MSRATDYSPEYYPWTRPDTLPHAITSAGWGERYPALQYDRHSPDRFIPRAVIEQIVLQERFAVVVWQGIQVTFIDIEHIPERSFAVDEDYPDRSIVDWASIKRYRSTSDGHALTAIKEALDPREIMPDVYTLLTTPLGFSPGNQTIVATDDPITEILIEFPHYRENRQLKLDTTIGVLGGIARQEYLDTIYGPATV